MAHASAPCCELRPLVLHTYPVALGLLRRRSLLVEQQLASRPMAMSASTPMGRRGKPVKKLRLIPAEKAFALARKFQGRFGTTVSVL